MNSSLDFDEVLNEVMDSVMHVTKAQRGFLMIADDAGELRTLVIKGADGAQLDEEGYSTTIVRRVVETRQPLLTNNAEFDNRFQAGQSIIMRGLRAISVRADDGQGTADRRRLRRYLDAIREFQRGGS
jgi:transcriptional regulator with GAF, ATPase, and Fis domain